MGVYDPALMLHHKKHEQHPQTNGWHREEVHGNDLAQVIAQESVPRLGRWPFHRAEDGETLRSETTIPSFCNSP
jgi:hypothetical protein